MSRRSHLNKTGRSSCRPRDPYWIERVKGRRQVAILDLVSIDASEDKLPKRFYGRFRNDNSATGQPLDESEVDDAIHRVYKRIGWDEQGVPTRESLERLGIGWVHDAMAPTAATIASKRELVFA